MVAPPCQSAAQFSRKSSWRRPSRVAVSSVMDAGLLNEALFRELVRKVQNMRKKAGLKVGDRIALTLDADEKTSKFLKKTKKELVKEVGAKSIAVGKLAGDKKEELKFKSIKVSISFSAV